jgi:hypothetical protein
MVSRNSFHHAPLACCHVRNKQGCRERSVPAGVRGAPEKLLFLLFVRRRRRIGE